MKLHLFVFMFLYILSVSLFAQPGVLDPRFNPGTGANDWIETIARQSDGKLIIGGHFTTYDGHPSFRIARVLPQGKIDTTFHTGDGFNDWVNALCIQPDGKILVGGRFGYYNNDSVGHIVRLMPNGERDTTFKMSGGFNDNVKVIRQLNDGRLMVGGSFTQYKDTMANRIIRLFEDGTIDESFDLTYGADDGVIEIKLLSNGDMYIGGSFIFYGGTSIKHVHMRYAHVYADGRCDTLFSAYNASREVYSIDTLPNGNVLVGGRFPYYDQQPRKFILKTYKSGTNNSSFSMNNGTNAPVEKVMQLHNGYNLIAGEFDYYTSDSTQNDSVNGICVIDNYGIRQKWFNAGSGIKTPGNIDLRINDFVLTPNQDRIVIAGNFGMYNGIPRANIAQLYNCFTESPQAIQGPDTITCAQLISFSIPPIQNVSKYKWNLPNGWVGHSDSSTIWVYTDGKSGDISVQAFTDSCGYSLPVGKRIYGQQPPSVNICLITVDTNSTHNVVIWEKPSTNLIDSFIIYREFSTNIYSKVGAVPYNSTSIFHDYSANPNTTTYRYKITSLSSCGIESNKSPYHQSIHLQYLGQGNFIWSFYEIENSPNPVLSYNFYRDNNGNSIYNKIGYLPGTNASFTDVNYDPIHPSNYYVDVYWNISCQFPGTVNTTRSNIKKSQILNEIDERIYDSNFTFYPNPTSQTLFIKTEFAGEKSLIRIQNAVGEIVFKNEYIDNTNNIIQVDLNGLPNGVYNLQVISGKKIYNSKVILH
ncbi:MAG: T9SS type A sorting domain-containing protein [Chitinophagales bacterium]